MKIAGFNLNKFNLNIETILVIVLLLGLIISYYNKEGLDNLTKSKLLYTKQAPTKPKEGQSATDFSISCSTETGDDPKVCETKCEAEEKCKNYYWYPASRGNTYSGKARCCLKGDYDPSTVKPADGDFYQMIIDSPPPEEEKKEEEKKEDEKKEDEEVDPTKDLDPCSDESKKDGGCGPVPENPKSACLEIQNRKAEMAEKLEKLRQDANVKMKQMDSESAAGFIKALGEGASDVLGNLTPFGALKAAVTNTGGGSIFGGDAMVAKSINNIFNTNINEKTISKINQTCASKAESQYTNSLDVKACTPETMGVSEETFKILVEDDRVGPFISNVNQSIKDKSTFECALNSFMNDIKENKTKLDKATIDETMNDLTGTGLIKVDKEGCNEQTTNKNTCSYLSEKQCCANVRRNVMQNSLNVGSCFADVRDINQNIQIQSASACGQEAETMKEHREDLDTKNKDKDKNKNDVSPNYVAWIIGGIIGVVCLIAAVKAGQMYLQAKSGQKISYQGNSE